MPRGNLRVQCIVGTARTALSNVATRLPRVGLGSGLAEPHRRTFAPASCLRSLDADCASASCLRWSATPALGARPSPHGFLRRNIQLKNEGKPRYHPTATGPIPQTIRRCAFRVQAGARKACVTCGIQFARLRLKKSYSQPCFCGTLKIPEENSILCVPRWLASESREGRPRSLARHLHC